MYARFRLEYLIAWIIVMFIVGVLVWLPPYELLVYQFSPVKDAEDVEQHWTAAIGYRGAKDIHRLTAVEGMNSIYSGYEVQVIETDVQKIQATGIYKDLSVSSGYEKNKLKVFFQRVIKQNYGQFYIVELESGEKILVLVNDYLFHIPFRGKVTLPIGRSRPHNTHYPWEEEYGVSGESFSGGRCFDCTSGFLEGPELRKLRNIQEIITIAACFLVPIVYGVLLIIMSKKYR